MQFNIVRDCEWNKIYDLGYKFYLTTALKISLKKNK